MTKTTKKLKSNATKSNGAVPTSPKVEPIKAAAPAKPAPVQLEAFKPTPVKPVAAPVEPAKPAPVKAIVAPVEAAKQTPAKAEPAKAPVAIIEPAKPAPAKVEPIKAAPTATAPVKPELPKPSRVALQLVKPGAHHVYVAGSFNDWNPAKTPLKHAGEGKWIGELTGITGRHEYMFVVDGQWLPDPNAKETVQNPFGGRNSVLVVSA